MRQQAATRIALARAGIPAPGSPLDSLQSARQAVIVAAQPTPEDRGQAQAGQRQAAMIANLGPDHPVGRAAAAALAASGRSDLMRQALAQYVANQPLRDAAPAGKAWSTAAKHQGNLGGVEETPGGSVGIDAINAAANELAAKARGTLRMSGQGAQGDSQPSSASQPASGPQAVPAAASSPAQTPGSGLMGLGDYLRSEALWRGGVALSNDDISTGLDRAAAAGVLTPPQYETIQSHLTANLPLHHAGGQATPALNAVISHALAAKTGTEPTGAADIIPPGGSEPQTTVRDPVKYAHGVQEQQATYREAMAALQSEGLPDAAQAVADARHVSDPSNRAAIFDRLDPVARARVRAIIGQKLYGK